MSIYKTEQYEEGFSDGVEYAYTRYKRLVVAAFISGIVFSIIPVMLAFVIILVTV